MSSLDLWLINLFPIPQAHATERVGAIVQLVQYLLAGLLVLEALSSVLSAADSRQDASHL